MKYLFEGQICCQVLGSGSKGNSLLIYDGCRAILVDAGLSGREIIKRLTELGIPLEQLRGVILTHEHSDHVRGLKGLLKQSKVDIWANIQTIQYLNTCGYEAIKWNSFDTGAEFLIDDISVRSFPVPHDAYDPCGFIITIGGVTVGILTDLGYCTDVVCEAAAQCQVLFVEANYDEQLLAQDTKRPWATKQRISARHGHLSNTQTAELLGGLKEKKSPLKHIFLGHMSEDCNDADLAVTEIQQALALADMGKVEVHLTYQSKVSDPVVI